jgi:drug/metabolite transporter (DMT)-like permease
MNPEQSADNLRGILMMLLAVAAFSLMDAGLKALSPHYPALQVAALRAWASLPVIIVWVALSSRGSFMRLLKVRWSLHLLRGVLGIAMLAGFAYAVRTLPLSEAYAIFFAAPLLITALAAPLLGERVTANRWWAIVIGLIGVLVVLRPGGEQLLSWAGLAGLLAALCYALSAITARVLGRTDSSISMVFWLMTMIAIGATVLNGNNWVAVHAEHAWILLGIALTGALGQYAVTEAFTRGQASLIAPFEYTALAWGCGLDWLIWATLPGYWVWVGAAIIIASGLYLLWSEKRIGAARRRADAAAMEAG